jgi:hypothetical protein
LLKTLFYFKITVVSEVQFSQECPEDQSVSPEFYYDISSGKLLVGRAAYEVHIESGGHPADVSSLGDFLMGDAEVIKPVREWRGNNVHANEWTKEECLIAGHWLINALQRQEYGKKYKLNYKLIEKAARMGIFPGTHRLERRFGNVSQFYRDLGSAELKASFNHILPSDAKEYLIDCCDELGSVPTRNELNQAAAIDKNLPSYEVLFERLPGGKNKFAREYGYWTPHEYSLTDCIDWGLDFMLANSGSFPTKDEMDSIYSTQNTGPSSAGIKKYFGSHRVYKAALAVAFDTELELNEERNRSLEKLPQELLEPLKPKDRATTYGRYRVARSLISNPSDAELIGLSSSGASDARFILALQSYLPEVSAGLLSSTASKLGLSSRDWRNDSRLDALGIRKSIEHIMRRNRGELSPEEELIMSDGIANGVDFLTANPYLIRGDRLMWKDHHINFLRSKNLIPTFKRIDKFYGGLKAFGQIIRAEYYRHETMRQQKEEELLAIINIEIENGKLPTELFSAQTGDGELGPDFKLTDHEKIVRYAKLTVLNELMATRYIPRLDTQRQIKICSSADGQSFNSQVRKAANGTALSHIDIETAASILHLSEYVYPELGKNHLQRFIMKSWRSSKNSKRRSAI